jgi:predicted DsbA family dithiol-disulfide isomerase
MSRTALIVSMTSALIAGLILGHLAPRSAQDPAAAEDGHAIDAPAELGERGPSPGEPPPSAANVPSVAGGPSPAPAPPPPVVPGSWHEGYYDLDLVADAPSKGARNPRITIQLYSDFECPFCVRAVPLMAEVLENYGDDVKVVWRNFPIHFHKNAMLAHQAAMEVYRQGGNAKFWPYHDRLFEGQRDLSRANLERWAAEVGGINMDEFREALDTGRHRARVEKDMEAVEKAGARVGTPAFFINGKLVRGAQPYNAFKLSIQRELGLL